MKKKTNRFGDGITLVEDIRQAQGLHWFNGMDVTSIDEPGTSNRYVYPAEVIQQLFLDIRQDKIWVELPNGMNIGCVETFNRNLRGAEPNLIEIGVGLIAPLPDGAMAFLCRPKAERGNFPYQLGGKLVHEVGEVTRFTLIPIYPGEFIDER